MFGINWNMFVGTVFNNFLFYNDYFSLKLEKKMQQVH